ncbi:unnamed protein product [Cylindrotheca closterium]|uniref:U6 small nuclear RNA (adenine-(43)-N(6))-methyltransferase n=1 Tax=Cylindrotheca closterium TaxID=2856 RepID=A0AAD2FLT9_9STRA|nr:unnamed protein product [Cylindrotheca closterium]
MDVDEPSASNGQKSKKRAHPDSSNESVSRTSSEVLSLVENPTFEELARQYPSFHKAWDEARQKQRDSGSRMNFSSVVSQEFTVSLTQALLQAYFNLRLPYLESNHLCPPVPNRFFYVHWIFNHLLKNEGPSMSKLGMDIGTGATCIYGLLAANFFHCNMAASDVDTNAIALARSNVAANQLERKILLLEVPPSHSQQPSLPQGGPLERTLMAYSNARQSKRFDFTMTNPPFYDPNSMEQQTSRAGDGRNRTSMTVSEGFYPNGEIGFVTDIFADSLRHRQSSLWFSSMLGKKSSLVKLEKLLIHVLGQTHVETTEYGPGQYTRWFLAWTFRRPTLFDERAFLSHGNNYFEVRIPEVMNYERAISEVASRVSGFCVSSPGGWVLNCQDVTPQVQPSSHIVLQIQEQGHPPVKHFADEWSHDNIVVPDVVKHALNGQDNTHFLPPEGHFAIQVAIDAPKAKSAEGFVVRVHLACYRHSSRGLKAVEKIRSGMEGEVTRTNRKWRRILQRQAKDGLN